MRNQFLKFSVAFLFITILILIKSGGFAQTSPTCYFVEFTDKKISPFSVNDPLKYLSQKALNRRAKHHISVTPQDFPVNPWYLDSLKATGAKVLFSSRWFNAATVSIDTSIILTKISNLSFIKNYSKVYKKIGVNTQVYQTKAQSAVFDENEYGESYPQIAMLNGQFLHQNDFKGNGVLMAVIDAGFFRVDSLDAFSYLFQNHRILATHDFVVGDDSVYEDATHGMLVLSAIAGRLPGKLLGTAPEASFILLRSENAGSEYLIEEDAWTVASEYADSAGVDLISSSLGYTTYDDPAMSHEYLQIDGKTTRVTKAANIAFSKGILVITSAGNEGNKSWKHISAPADGDSVLAIGAVDVNRKRARFSSLGPTFDGDIKPNVAAMGDNTICASTSNGETTTASGTSLSAPVLAGMAACLIGAFPDRTNREIKKAIEMSGSQYTNPDDSLGYGIPDFKVAYEILKLTVKETPKEDFKILEFYPNPFVSDITITYYSKDKLSMKIQVSDNMGRIVLDSNIITKENKVDKINLGMKNINGTGLFILTIDTGKQKITQKLIKLTAK